MSQYIISIADGRKKTSIFLRNLNHLLAHTFIILFYISYIIRLNTWKM